MHEAISVYRNHFKPSTTLDKPYVMLSIPMWWWRRPTKKAEYLATSVYRASGADSRTNLMQKPPVESMDGLWLPHERETVGSFLEQPLIGSPQSKGQGRGTAGTDGCG